MGKSVNIDLVSDVLSEAGKQFMVSLPAAAPTLPGADAVAKIRREGHAEFLPRAKRAVIKHDIDFRSIEVGGIPCLELLPKQGSSSASHTLLYFFGGGYVYGGAEDDMCISAALCGFSGARVIAPEYRLAPEHPYPAATDDGFQVFKALIQEHKKNRLVIAGESAGGNLALTVLQQARKANLPMPSRAALLSPWCDLTPWQEQQDKGSAFPDDPTLHRDDLNHYAAQYAPRQSLQLPEFSPLYGAFDQNFPPTMISTATRDILISQAVRLARRLRQVGVSADLRIYPDLCHVFECYDEIPEAEDSLRAFSKFLFSG